MTRVCTCFPSIAKDFLVQTLVANNREKLSIEEKLFLNNSLKSDRALAGELDLRYLLRAWLGLGGLR